MGIKFHCQQCGQRLNVKSFLAGMKGICPHCGASVLIPSSEPNEKLPENRPPPTSSNRGDPMENETLLSSKPLDREPLDGEQFSAKRVSSSNLQQNSTNLQQSELNQVVLKRGVESNLVTDGSAASVDASLMPQTINDPLADSQSQIWYVCPSTGGKYGPASGEMVRKWIQESRVTADCLMWREGWVDWKKADTVIPDLKPLNKTATEQSLLSIHHENQLPETTRRQHANYNRRRKLKSIYVFAWTSLLLVVILILIPILYYVAMRG